MSLTIQQLLLNHTRNISSNVHENKGEYFDTEIPRHLDLVDAMEYKENLAQEIKETEATAKAEAKKAKEARLEALKKKKAQDIEEAKKLLENEQEPPSET